MKPTVRWTFLAALVLALAAPASADGIPAGGQDPTRAVTLPHRPGVPVFIDSAYVDIVSGANGEHDDINVSCIRYRNVATEPLVEIHFKRTFLDGSRAVMGSDSVEAHTRRNPNAKAVPGVGLLKDAYWACSHTPNPYGPTMQTVTIEPVYAKCASGKTWTATASAPS
jgi:hypothetical protein